MSQLVGLDPGYKEVLKIEAIIVITKLLHASDAWQAAGDCVCQNSKSQRQTALTAHINDN